ncbi:hypothetical protein MRBLMN1_004109 [Chitinophaga ginsengisegetis]|uniref:PsbP-related protein n=1 Tax=Chitinophaga ginsengisegetis TaxID=393003 RepID=UPI00343C583D
MKYALLCGLVLLSFVVKGQNLVNYRDTANHFSVGIPNGWQVIKNKQIPSLKFMAQRSATDSALPATENFTVNVVEEPRSNVDAIAKKLLYYIGRNPYFKLLDSGSIVSAGKRMIWLDEIHLEGNRADTIFASIFIAYADNKTYLLTATTLSPFSASFKPLFHEIGHSFKTGKAARKERLKIALPAGIKWTMITDTEVDNLATRQFLPADETPQQWTLLINDMTMENARVNNIDLAVKSFSDAAVSKASQAKITVLGKENFPQRRWALFKVETPGAGNPESQLYYVIQGPKSFHAVFIAKKTETLPADFVSKWSAVFKKSKVVNE